MDYYELNNPTSLCYQHQCQIEKSNFDDLTLTITPTQHVQVSSIFYESCGLKFQVKTKL